jgi:hypothetical protein
MAQVAPGQDDIKALEQARQRLSQLKSNIISLQQDVARSSTLPQWYPSFSYCMPPRYARG